MSVIPFINNYLIFPNMTPEAKAREEIDKKLVQSGWVIQDVKEVNLMASLGVAVREFPTDSGPVDYGRTCR